MGLINSRRLAIQREVQIELLKCEYCEREINESHFLTCNACLGSVHHLCESRESEGRNYTQCVRCNTVGSIVTSNPEYLCELINGRSNGAIEWGGTQIENVKYLS